MRKFDYRAPRYAVDISVRFTVDEATYIGRCKEISVEGMKMELDQPFEPGSTGTARFSARGATVDLAVRVCYSDPNYIGLKFLYDSDEQRDEILRLVTRCAGPRFHSADLSVW